MVENERLRHELVSESTGEVYSSRRINNVNKVQLSIPVERQFGKNRFLIEGAGCLTMNFKLAGALAHLCHAYLHFDTLLLHKKDELNHYKRLEVKDFMLVLNLKPKATRKYLKELIDYQALIRPNNEFRYFVSPRFLIRRGGYISFEEIDMLLKHDLLIKDCLNHSQLIQYKSWKRLKKFI